MNSSQLINQNSGNFEYYTPIELVNAARLVMGNINLDPASSETANNKIKADYYFSKDGLDKTWFGNVWMNHPFSRTNNPLWINKLVNSYEDGDIEEACCITFAATSERWFRPLLGHSQCFIHGRTNYYLPDGTKKAGVTKGSVITYFGDDEESFADIFSQFGTVK